LPKIESRGIKRVIFVKTVKFSKSGELAPSFPCDRDAKKIDFSSHEKDVFQGRPPYRFGLQARSGRAVLFGYPADSTPGWNASRDLFRKNFRTSAKN
jgi:hypothetical protein